MLSLCMVMVRWKGLVERDSELGLGRGWGQTGRLWGPGYPPVPSDHDDLLGRCPLQHPVGSVRAPPGTVTPVNLQDLIPKAQPHERRRAVGLHQLHEEPLEEDPPSALQPTLSPGPSCGCAPDHLGATALCGQDSGYPISLGRKHSRPHSQGAAESGFQPWLEAAPPAPGLPGFLQWHWRPWLPLSTDSCLEARSL